MSGINERFAEARLRVLGETSIEHGFSSIAERPMHKMIKLYIEPDESHHEIDFLGSVADVKNESGIYEVQTRSLGKLLPKLKKFLKETRVTVVYPMHMNKTISWLDSESGELSPPRKSSKHECPIDSVYELYNIREVLSNPSFSLRLMFFNTNEIRLRGIHRKIGKKYRSQERVECIPETLAYEIEFHEPRDYLALLPEGLPERFCMSDINTVAGHRFRHGFSLLAILKSLGLLTEPEHEGRKIFYQIAPGFK